MHLQVGRGNHNVRRSKSLFVLFAVFVAAHIADARIPASPDPAAFGSTGFRPERGYFSLFPWMKVDMVNGDLTLTATDIVLPGNAGMDVRITRTFSLSRGYWTFSFVDVPLRLLGAGNPQYQGFDPRLVMADGSEQKLFRNVPTFGTYWVTTTFSKLDPATNTLYLPNGWVATYQPWPSCSGPFCEQNLRLASITDQYGNSATANYGDQQSINGITSVTQVVAGSGSRTVAFAPSLTFPIQTMSYLGRTWSYTIGETGSNLVATPPAGAPWTYVDSGSALTVTTPNGGQVTFAYETQGTRKKVTQMSTSGRAISPGTWTFNIPWDGDPLSSSVTLPSNRQLTFVHDLFSDGPDGKLWTLRDRNLLSGGAPVATLHNEYRSIPFADGKSLRAVDARTVTQGGVTYTTEFDYSPGNFGDYLQPKEIVETASPGKARTTTRTFEYFTGNAYLLPRVNSQSVEVDSQSFTQSISYEGGTGFPVSQTSAGMTTTMARNNAGNATSITDPLNHTVTHDYHWGVPQTTSGPGGVVARTINQDGTVAAQNHSGAVTTFDYDLAGRPTSVSPPEGAATTTTYASDGSWVMVTRAGSWVRTTVDGFGRSIETENAVGVRTTITYDNEGQKIAQSAPSTGGAVPGNSFEYDALGRITRIVHAGDGSVVQYAYSGSSVTITDENGNATTQSWEPVGSGGARLTSLIDARGKTWSYSYNAFGSLTRVVQPQGPDRIWVYDANNRLMSETQPESGTTTFSYNGEGLLTSKSDALGRSTTFSYDDAHRLVFLNAPGTADDVEHVYDSRGNRIRSVAASTDSTFSYDGASRLITRTDVIAGNSFATSYQYDSRENITQVTYPSGRVVQYQYDAASRITKVYSGATTYADNVQYHATGALISMTYGNQLTETMTLNSRFRPETLTSGPLQLTYTYQPNGNVSAITDPRPGMSATYTYDQLDRLTSVTGFGAVGYTYDDLGNRLTRDGALGVAYTYDAATNRLMNAASALSTEAGTFAYDHVGNMLTDTQGVDPQSPYYRQFTYTAHNQMSSALVAGVTTNYVYNADGQRVQKSSAAGQQYFVHGLGGQLLAEYAALLVKTAPASGTTTHNVNQTLKWTPVPNATYSVCVDTTNNASCDTSWESTGTATLKALTSLAPGTYYWQARATTSSGTAQADNGAWWSFTITSDGFGKLGPPSGQSGLPANVNVSWASVPDSGYWVCWDTTNNNSCDAMWWPNGAQTWKLLEGLAPATYYWQVRADTPWGVVDADAGQWWSFTVGGGATGFSKLSPAQGLTGLATNVVVEWTTVPNEGYWVCWDQIDNGACDTMWWPNGAQTWKLLEGLAPGVYYWQVKTSDSGEHANGGQWWAFAVGAPQIDFEKQAPGHGAILTANATTLTWTAAPGASFYETCVDQSDNGNCDTMWMPAGPSLTRQITGLTDGTYYWQVRATTQGGASYANLGAWWRITVDAPDPIREYVYLGSKLIATITLSTGAPVTNFYHTDVLGSVRAITAANGATVTRHDYRAFGESDSVLTGDPRRYLGQELDAETAFHHLGARAYRNLWGRFTTVDPVLPISAKPNPQRFNRYSYGLNGPLRYSDSSGLVPQDPDPEMAEYGTTGFDQQEFDEWVNGYVWANEYIGQAVFPEPGASLEEIRKAIIEIHGESTGTLLIQLAGMAYSESTSASQEQYMAVISTVFNRVDTPQGYMPSLKGSDRTADKFLVASQYQGIGGANYNSVVTGNGKASAAMARAFWAASAVINRPGITFRTTTATSFLFVAKGGEYKQYVKALGRVDPDPAERLLSPGGDLYLFNYRAR